MINVFSPINQLGYGQHSCSMIKALIENGQEINLTTIGEVQLDSFYEMYIKEAVKNQNKFNVKNPSVFIFHDNFSHQACGSPLFTFSIFETSLLKPNSKIMLENGPTNIILTTTKEHAELLKEQGITKPIEVVNEGVDDTIFNTIPVDKYIDTKKMTYLLAGKREERKNTDAVIRTFINLMKEKEVALICHTFNPFINNTKDHPFKNLSCWCGLNPIKYNFEYKGFNGKAHIFTYKNCDIYFTTPTIPLCNMPSLYHSANIGIQVSRGEGWDLPCILPGTKIITYAGIKNIEDVNKNDRLLSHEGYFRDIKKIMKHKNNKKTFEIKCWGNNEALKVTEEHPLYGIKKENIKKYNNINYLEPEWIKAKDIKKGDILIKSAALEENKDFILDLKTLDTNLLYDNEYVWYKTSYNSTFKNSISKLCSIYNVSKHIMEDAIKIVKGKSNNKFDSMCTNISQKLKKDNIEFNKVIKIKRFININDISELIGLYIAEGSSDKSKICLTIHEKEKDICLEMVKRNLKLISDDVSVWIKKHKDSKAIDICISGKIISKTFEYLCNKGAYNKKIPKEILYGSKNSLSNLIKWYHFGDGCVYNNIYSISTASIELAEQVCIAIQKLNLIPLKSKSKNNQYNVYWIVNKKERKVGSGNRVWQHNNNNLAIMVKEIKEILYTDDVYNFEVDVDNSYTLGICTVHNCTEMLACGLPVIATDCLGHNEYLNEKTPEIQKNLLVRKKDTIIADDGLWFKGEQGIWDNLNIESFTSILEYTFINSSIYISKNEELATYMSENYSWNNSVKKLLEIIDNYKG